MTLVTDFIATARRSADRPALVHGGRRLDYGALLDLTRRLAGRLSRHGVNAGHVVMVALRDTPEHFAAWLAIQWLGAVALPVDHRLTPREINAIARAMSTRAILSERRIDSAWPHIDVEALDGESPVESPPRPGGNDPAFLGLSSGTSGAIKAAELTHSQIQARLRVFNQRLTGGAPDRFLCVLHLAFGYARAALARLTSGATVVLLPPPTDGGTIRRTVAEHGITSIAVTPNILDQLDPPDGTVPALPALGCLQVGAATLTPARRARARVRVSPNLYEVYATAIGGIVTIATPADQVRAPDAVGRPIDEVEIQIVDDAGQVLPRGEIGAIRFRGPSCAARIIGGSELADERIHDGWVYPGDIGTLTGAGDLVLHGRTTDMIKRGAVTVFAPEIERFLLTIPGVADAAVIGATSAVLGEDLIAFVVLNDHGVLDGVMRRCRVDLAGYKRPGRIIHVDALPRNAAGKVIKRDLAKLLG